MSELNKVVARFLDGTLVKGTTEDFYPNRPSFHMLANGSDKTEEIRCALLKAVFFVRDFEGNPSRADLPGYETGVGPTLGKKIAVQFKDGEVICGYTLSYSTERAGFFLIPADERGNNLRVYVLKHATKKVLVGPDADQLARLERPDAA